MLQLKKIIAGVNPVIDVLSVTMDQLIDLPLVQLQKHLFTLNNHWEVYQSLTKHYMPYCAELLVKKVLEEKNLKLTAFPRSLLARNPDKQRDRFWIVDIDDAENKKTEELRKTIFRFQNTEERKKKECLEAIFYLQAFCKLRREELGSEDWHTRSRLTSIDFYKSLTSFDSGMKEIEIEGEFIEYMQKMGFEVEDITCFFFVIIKYELWASLHRISDTMTEWVTPISYTEVGGPFQPVTKKEWVDFRNYTISNSLALFDAYGYKPTPNPKEEDIAIFLSGPDDCKLLHCGMVMNSPEDPSDVVLRSKFGPSGVYEGPLWMMSSDYKQVLFYTCR